MLILSRRIGEAICIGDAIRIQVVAVDGNRVRLGFKAPPHITVDRQEVYEEKRKKKDGPATPRN